MRKNDTDTYKIRLAAHNDLPRISEIYQAARDYMARNGNAAQWGGIHPRSDLLVRDIDTGRLYVMLSGGVIHGVFTFIIGSDPTYIEIDDGNWLSDEPYGTIHRIASDGKRGGVFEACLEFCLKMIGNIRIDTHADNKKMQVLLQDNGFSKCGTIYVTDAAGERSPRIAYQFRSPGMS